MCEQTLQRAKRIITEEVEKAGCRVVKVILFGSRARGMPAPIATGIFWWWWIESCRCLACGISQMTSAFALREATSGETCLFNRWLWWHSSKGIRAV